MRPLAYDLYFIGGILYYRASDTITSNAYFKKSLRICNAVLDTMKSRSWEYYGLVINKAVVLKILGNNKESDLVFKKLQDSTIDDQIKARTKTIMSKSRIEILSK